MGVKWTFTFKRFVIFNKGFLTESFFKNCFTSSILYFTFLTIYDVYDVLCINLLY